MPVAAFVIVVVGLLVAVMSRINAEGSLSGAQEQASIQAFYAAESGAQYAAHSLYFDALNPVSRATVSAACATINGDTLTFSSAGMNGCETDILCSEQVDSGNTQSFFRITSSGRCGVDTNSALRVIEVNGVME